MVTEVARFPSICVKRKNKIIGKSKTAKSSLETQAFKIRKLARGKILQGKVCDTVKFWVPDVDRGRCESRKILGVIMDVDLTKGLNKIVTKDGILNSLYTRNQLTTYTEGTVNISGVPSFKDTINPLQLFIFTNVIRYSRLPIWVGYFIFFKFTHVSSIVYQSLHYLFNQRSKLVNNNKGMRVLLFDSFKHLLLRKTDFLKICPKSKFLGKKTLWNALALKSEKVQGIFTKTLILSLSSAAFRLQNLVSDLLWIVFFGW